MSADRLSSPTPSPAGLQGLLPWPHALVLISLLFILQLAAGTDFDFASMILVYALSFLAAYNLLGGTKALAALLLASMAGKTVLFSQVMKVVLWEPAQKHLIAPQATVEALAFALVVTLGAAVVASNVPLSLPHVFAATVKERTLNRLTWVCLALGALSTVSKFLLQASGDRLLFGINTYLGNTPALAVICATAHRIIQTKGQRSMSWPGAVGIALLLVGGVAATSKQIMMESFLSYAVTCICFKYRLRARHYSSAVAAVAFSAFVIYPVVNASRAISVPSMNAVSRAAAVLDWATQLTSTDIALLYTMQRQGDLENSETYSYYDRSLSILERFSLIKAVDHVVSTTARKGPLGIEFWLKGIDILPNSFTGGYPFNMNNVLGRWTGQLSESDFGTAVSYTPMGDAYAAGEMMGVLTFYGVAILLLFITLKAFFPDIRGNIWGIWVLMSSHHNIAESNSTTILFFLFRALPAMWLLRAGLLWFTKDLSRARYSPTGYSHETQLDVGQP